MKKVINFDVEKAKSGEYKVVTREGNPARIICWDKKGINNVHPIVALATNNSIWYNK